MGILSAGKQNYSYTVAFLFLVLKTKQRRGLLICLLLKYLVVPIHSFSFGGIILETCIDMLSIYFLILHAF